MPDYDYKCRVCKEEIEVYREYRDDHKPSHCGQLMERIWNNVAVKFKGGGWGGQK